MPRAWAATYSVCAGVFLVAKVPMKRGLFALSE